MPVLVRMIMRWSTFYVLVAMMHHEQMAILDTCYEFYIRIVLSQGFIEILDEYISIFCLQVTTIVCDDLAILHVDDVAAKRQVGWLQFVADAGCLQWTASFVNLILVVAHDRAVGYL